ncbi:MAG: putative porin [bacterium]|jgi:hypothetical protein
MNRFIAFFAAVALAVGLSAGLAFAQSNNTFPPSDLPQDHWAWQAVKYMMETGILEGYPGNEYRGNQTMTRYEFSVALNRVILWIEGTYGDAMGADVKATIDALEAEFSDELAEIRNQVEANTQDISSLKGSMDAMGERVTGLEKKIGNIAWKGDFRYRWAYTDTEAGDTERFFERMRLRLSFSAPIVENMLDFKGRLATGPGGVSTNQTFDSYNTNYPFGLDLAYLEYKAEWLPVKNTWYFGRFPNFLMGHQASGIVWDSDINFDGTGQHFEFPFYGGDYQFNAIQSILNEYSGAAVEDDEWMIGWQLGAKNFYIPNFNWYAGYYHYQNLVGGGFNFNADGYMGNTAGGAVDVNLDGAINNFDSIATKYDVLNIGGDYTFNMSEGGQPIMIHADYVANLNPEIPFSTDTRLSIDDDDHWGMLAGFRYGAAKTKGTWDFGYYYKNVGATAVVGAFSDADDYGSNVIAHNIYFDYALADNTMFTLEYILHDLKNDFGYLPDDTRNILYADIVVKF